MLVGYKNIYYKYRTAMSNNETINDDVLDQKEETAGTSIPLFLGDIIKIAAPNNEIFNEQTFLIDYIDKRKIILINTTSLERTLLKIQEDGTLGDGTITSIDLIQRNKYPGYARQNNLLPGIWINIYFGGDVPAILTGEITNLEEDMIEVRTYPDNDMIYINFNYSGIPEDLPIDTFEIRPPPDKGSAAATAVIKKTADADADVGLENVPVEETKNEVEDMEQPESESTDEPKHRNIAAENADVDNEQYANIPVTNVKDYVQQLILQGNEIVFNTDETLGQVTQLVEKKDSKMRYSIQAQCDDLLDEMLSTIPNSQRTQSVLHNIHLMIERFKQLRTQFSNLDDNGNVDSALIKGAAWKPLVDELTKFNKALYWLLPVVKNIKKVYNVGDDVDEHPDVIAIKMNDDLATIRQNIEYYKSNSFPNEQNKYNALMTELNTQFTPFEEPYADNTQSILYVTHVGTNLNTIVDNLGQFYSTIAKNDMLTTRKFIIQKYNLGMNKLMASQITSSRMIAKRTDLTEPDTMYISSIATMPEPVVRFSRINLPSTSILERSNLNESFLNYWEFLKNNTSVQDVIVDTDTLDGDNEITNETFISNIKNYVLNVKPDDNLTRVELYKQFLNKIIPKTKTLFNLTKKYITGKVSLVDVIDYLEPFLVYTNDLSFMQYVEINKFINKKINDYNKTIVERSHAFFSLKSAKYNVSLNPSANAIYSILKKESESVFQNGYQYDKSYKFTNSELIGKIITKDMGHLYNSALALSSVPLMFPDDLASIFEQESKTNKELMLEYSKNNKCNTYIIAKQYTSVEELEADNGRDIYFDKKYDKTRYSILDDYEKEMTTKTPDEFIEFLITKLQKNEKLSTDDAIYLADTLITGMKKVTNGQYAFIFNINLQEGDSITYFKRVDNKWQTDTEVDKSFFVNDDNLLCNIQKDCIAVDTKCEPINLNKADLQSAALKNIINEFDKKYILSKQDLERKLRSEFDYYNTIMPKIGEIEFHDMFQYNNYKFALGMKLTDKESVAVVSPYYPVLNQILGQTDFVKKQNDIIRFVMEFTREALENTEETIHWRYCIKTGVKLIPSFRYTLAAAFINDPTNYGRVVESLKQKIGKLGDDGEAWVDEHSGQVIQLREFDQEEGYTEEGVKIQSRGLLEQDAGDALIGHMQHTPKTQTHEMKVCTNIINAFAFVSNMGINLEDQREFIVNLATSVFLSMMPKEAAYNKELELAAKRDKTLPSYNELYNFNILYITMAVILIAIQASIPSITTRKTFPGCVRSFEGYPIDGSGDLSAVNYMACIAYHIRSPSEPWKVLMKKKQPFIAEKLKGIIEAHFIGHADVIRKFRDKAEYLLTAPVEAIPQEHAISNWTQFLPPLFPIKITHLAPLTPEFKDKLLNDLKSGYHAQREDLLVVASKRIMFSLAIQERIQKIVSKKTMLLTNMVNDPFIENACCNEKNTDVTAIQYFINEDKEIGAFNAMVQNLSNILDDVDMITKARLFYSPINTKNIYPPVKQEFNETTIYRAFIVYCKFNTIFPVPDDLVKYCNDKPLNIKSSETLNEMIVKLKNDGRNYTNASLINLFQLVSRRNIINTSVIMPTGASIQQIRNLIDEMDESNEMVVEATLRDMLAEKMDTFDFLIQSEEDRQQSRKFKNYIGKRNDELRESITAFIKSNNDLPVSRQKKLDTLLKDIMIFDTEKELQMPGISDSNGYNFMQRIKGYIHNMVSVFPNMILNQVDYENTAVPSYWGLSNIHKMNISNIIKDDLSPLRAFYSKKLLTRVLQTIQERCKHLLTLTNETPYFTAIQDKESVFDQATCLMLFEHYMLLAFTEYIALSTDPNMLFVEEAVTEQLQETFTIEDLDDESGTENFVTQTKETDILLQGNLQNLKTGVASLLLTYLRLIKDNQYTTDYSYEEVMDYVFKLKEREKDLFTDKLQGMTDEQRDVDNILKEYRLGDWSKGLQKGVTKYVGKTYDEEREIMSKIANMERTDGRKRTDAEDDPEQLEEIDADDMADAEVYDMVDMNDDYGDGNFGADEVDNQGDYE
jgi:hypothetical protein